MLTPLAHLERRINDRDNVTQKLVGDEDARSFLPLVPMVTDSTWPPLWPNSLPILQQFIFRDYRDARIRIMLYKSVLQPPLF